MTLVHFGAQQWPGAHSRCRIFTCPGAMAAMPGPCRARAGPARGHGRARIRLKDAGNAPRWAVDHVRWTRQARMLHTGRRCRNSDAREPQGPREGQPPTWFCV